MRTELLNKEKIEANDVEWWEVRVAANNETGDFAVIMYFKTQSGEERTYALHKDSPMKFLAALGSCVNAINELSENSELSKKPSNLE